MDNETLRARFNEMIDERRRLSTETLHVAEKALEEALQLLEHADEAESLGDLDRAQELRRRAGEVEEGERLARDLAEQLESEVERWSQETNLLLRFFTLLDQLRVERAGGGAGDPELRRAIYVLRGELRVRLRDMPIWLGDDVNEAPRPE